MSKVKMMSPAVPNMPWQDRADGKTSGVADLGTCFLCQPSPALPHDQQVP